jgi:very-short-patch-repair endonuclease
MGEDRTRTVAVAAAQGGVISAAQLRASGLSDGGIAHRVRARRLFRVRRGVYSLSPYVDVWGRRWAAVLQVDPLGAQGAMLSHRSAGEVHGIATPRGGRIDVTIPGVGGRTVAGLRLHRARSLRPGDVVTVRGLRVTSVPRTVLDLAGTENDDVVRRLIREGEFQGLLPVGAMTAAATDRGGHPGVGRVRRVDPATHEAALPQTPLEDALAALIRRLPLPSPTAQLPIITAAGTRYRADFAWPQWRLIAEADGRAAHARASRLDEDHARDADLSADGWLTMRFTRVQVFEDAQTAGDRIVRTAFSRGWVPGREIEPVRRGRRAA